MIETICTRLNCGFFDQISGTGMGALVVFSGASFGGKIRSRRFCQKLVSRLQFTSRSEFTGPPGPEWKNSLKFSPSPVPNRGAENAVGAPARIFTGRSVRKSLRFENRLFRLDSWEGEARRPSRSVGSEVERPASSSIVVKSGIRVT